MITTHTVLVNGNLAYSTSVMADAYAKFERVAADLEAGEHADYAQNGAPLESWRREPDGSLLWLDHSSEEPSWVAVEG